MAKKANKDASVVDVSVKCDHKSSTKHYKSSGITLNTSSKEDWDNAFALRRQMVEWCMEKGARPDTEMMTLWVGYDGDALQWHGRDVAIKIMPNDANGESQALWDLYLVSETEDEFIEKFREWRAYVRKQLAVDKTENVANISSGEAV